MLVFSLLSCIDFKRKKETKISDQKQLFSPCFSVIFKAAQILSMLLFLNKNVF